MSEGWTYRLETQGGDFVLLPEGDIVIGRSRTCDVSINEPSVSRRHAEVKVGSGKVRLQDVGSSNGTFVNGLRVTGRVDLKDGDAIRLGDAEFLYRVEAPSFQTIRMDAHTLDDGARGRQEPGEATTFLRQASVDIAQQVEERVNQLGEGALGDGEEVARAEDFAAARVSFGRPPEDIEEGGIPSDFASTARLPSIPPSTPLGPELTAPQAVAPSDPFSPPDAQEVASLDITHPEAPPDEASGAYPQPPISSGESDGLGGRLADPDASQLLQPLEDIPELLGEGGPKIDRAAVSPEPPKSLPELLPAAGFWRRAAATVVDGLWMSALGLLVLMPQGNPFDLAGALSVNPQAFLGPGLACLLVIVGWAFWGTTPGKWVLGLAVCKLDGSAGIGLWRALVRFVGYLVSALVLGVGFLMIFSPSRRALHDRMAGCYVARRL